MKTTRRDLFKFAAGGSAGLLLTPAPWRLVTDAALWSENWPGIPRPLRGEIRTRFTHCSLCPAGCAVRARCVGDQPISLAGLAGAPLCAFGLTGHHLPYHAERVTRGDPEAAAAAIARRGETDSIAVLDLRPGRTASWTYRRAMTALPGGLYLAAQSALPAVNLENVKTILSFGVPVLDGWGTPAHVLALRPRFRVIQAEPVESHSAILADLWLPIVPGTEDALTKGLSEMIAGRAGDGRPSGVARTAQVTGLPEAMIASVAREIAGGSALVLAARESADVLLLNQQLGAYGRTIVRRHETPVPEQWKKAAAATPMDAVPDHSIGVLLIDETVCDAYYPWALLERKLADRPVVVTFSSSRDGYGRHAQFVLPAAVYPEATGDASPAIDSLAPTFRLTTPLVEAPPGVVAPADFVARLAGLPAGDALRERADAIHASRRGLVLGYSDGSSVALKDMSAGDFWKALNHGGRWADPEAGVDPAEYSGGAQNVPVVAMTWERRGARHPLSPLVSKLYQESNLRSQS